MNKNIKNILLLLIIITFCPNISFTQNKTNKDSIATTFTKDFLKLSEDQLIKIYNKMPDFGMFHDNYFVTGVPINKKITKRTADAKFQISVRQRLIKSILPFNTIIFITYTQKSFWDIYKKSSPFADNNYNPGISIGKPLIFDNKLRGMGIISVEHESNGLAGINSRSWNYIIFSGVFFFNNNASIQTKTWIGIMSNENKDLLDYRGYGSVAFNFKNKKNTFRATCILNPSKKFQNLNSTIEINWKPIKKGKQYIFLQWYNGYGESLLDYNKYSAMIRIGLCIKPNMRNLY